MARPVIALLTDFGTANHYVGAMKGVMLGICPDAALVDITHEVAPYDVLGGSLELAACRHAFPAGTVFLAVIDPGVGSSRRGIAAASAEHLFVAPDNGVLTAVFHDAPPAHVVELSGSRFARPVVSRTFEGRDRFAPAAAWLAAGLDLATLGTPATDIVRLCLPVPTVEPGRVAGEVSRVDRFGNIVTNIDRRAWDGAALQGTPEIRAGGRLVGRLVDTYAEIRHEEIAALFGSSDHLEISARETSATEVLSIRRGDPIVVRWLG